MSPPAVPVRLDAPTEAARLIITLIPVSCGPAGRRPQNWFIRILSRFRRRLSR